MFKPLLQFVLMRRPIVILALLTFIGVGVLSFLKLNVEAYPNPAPVIIEITAQSPGTSAEEMERYYTRPIEIGLSTVPGRDIIRSTSFAGLSFVRVTFYYGVDYFFALTQIANALSQNVNLPNGVQTQIQASSLVGEIYRYQVKGSSAYSLTELRTIQDWVIVRRLLTVPGIVQVVTWGGTTKEYHVEVNPKRLEGYGITLQQVITSIGNANTNVGGRTVSVGDQSVNVRGVGLVENLADIEKIVLNQQNGLPVRIKDIATVTEGYVPRLGEAGRDAQKDVVTGVIIMNRTLQTNKVIEVAKAAVAKLNVDGSLPVGVKIEPYYDRSTLIGVTTHTVIHNLIFGCLLVFLIQLVFLGDLRSAIIVSINIPFALFFSIIILTMTGESANLLSLGAVDFGIIVDSAVILVENVFRNFQQRPEDKARDLRQLSLSPDGLMTDPSTGWTGRLRLIYLSAIQVDVQIMFSTAITIAAFLPLFTMTGVEGQIFGPMARTYAYALAGALLATFSITPVITSLLLPRKVKEHETKIVEMIRQFYTPKLTWVMAHTQSVVIGAMIALLIGAYLLTRLGSEFLPALEEGNLWIRASMPPTISLEAGTANVHRMRELISRHPEVITVVSQHGRPDDGSDASGFNNVELFAPLKPFDEWPKGSTKEKLVAGLQADFENEFPGVTTNFSQYIQDNVQEGLSGVKGANSVKVIGPDLVMLEKIATDIKKVMSDINGVSDLGIFYILGQPNANVVIDREKAARYGLNTGDVNATIQAAFAGTVVTTVLEGDRQFGLSVRLNSESRKSMEDLENLRIGYTATNGTVAYIPLADLASVRLDTGATYVFHEKNERYIPIKFSTRGRDLGSTVAEIQQKISEKINLPEGYRIEYAGEFEELQAAQKRLAIVVPIALVLIMALLYALFNSLMDCMLTIAGVPFAMLGGVIALYMTGQAVSVSAIIGFISLLGVSVMNGILVQSYYRELIHTGRSKFEAIFEAHETRMRPLLMTALSAAIGLFPAAISNGIGSQVQKPLATVVVGGMLIGPLFLLLVVPAIYQEVLKRHHPKKRRKGFGG
jgi:cobalt-zinc-cadmium resistance protein CzcA